MIPRFCLIAAALFLYRRNLSLNGDWHRSIVLRPARGRAKDRPPRALTPPWLA